MNEPRNVGRSEETLSSFVLHTAAFAVMLGLYVLLLVMYASNASLTCTGMLEGSEGVTRFCILANAMLLLVLVLLYVFLPGSRERVITVISSIAFATHILLFDIILLFWLLTGFAIVFGMWGGYAPFNEMSFVTGIHALALLVDSLAFIYSQVALRRMRGERRKMRRGKL